VAEYTLDRENIHYKWDNALEPALTVEPGDIVHCWTDEVSAGQVTPGCDAEVLSRLDFDRVYPLAGPIAVHSARPGDALEVEVLSLRPDEWGWTGILPGLGLLAEDFPSAYIKHWDLSNGRAAEFRPGITVPLQPFCGTMGVAPAEPGKRAVMPPGDFGGNMDIRHLNAGSRLLLPVQVSGGLFSAGDGHAVQGDGEVCVTAIECPMSFSLRFNLRRGAALQSPAFFTGRHPLSAHESASGYYVTTGVGPDLLANAKNAVRRMIDWLSAEHNLSPEDAYLLSSVAGDLKVSEVVDRPNWIVSFYMPSMTFG
jgi:acetamidase/formamidase